MGKAKKAKGTKGTSAKAASAKAGATAENGSAESAGSPEKIENKRYEKELFRLQVELVTMVEWIKHQGLKVVVIFEGRERGRQGRRHQAHHPAPEPAHLPGRGAARPDRARADPVVTSSATCRTCPPPARWSCSIGAGYNRAGVERVMGFCTDEEYREFLRTCPEFERMLVRSGIKLIKYWFSVSDEEQEKRFQSRLTLKHKRWKLSPMDLESRRRWADYSRAKDEMFAHTDIKQAPWYVVDADVKKHARLNCISHLLSMFPYEDLTPESIELPQRTDAGAYVRPPITDQTFVPPAYP